MAIGLPTNSAYGQETLTVTISTTSVFRAVEGRENPLKVGIAIRSNFSEPEPSFFQNVFVGALTDADLADRNYTENWLTLASEATRIGGLLGGWTPRLGEKSIDFFRVEGRLTVFQDIVLRINPSLERVTGENIRVYVLVSAGGKSGVYFKDLRMTVHRQSPSYSPLSQIIPPSYEYLSNSEIIMESDRVKVKTICSIRPEIYLDNITYFTFNLLPTSIHNFSAWDYKTLEPLETKVAPGTDSDAVVYFKKPQPVGFQFGASFYFEPDAELGGGAYGFLKWYAWPYGGNVTVLLPPSSALVHATSNNMVTREENGRVVCEFRVGAPKGGYRDWKLYYQVNSTPLKENTPESPSIPSTDAGMWQWAFGIALFGIVSISVLAVQLLHWRRGLDSSSVGMMAASLQTPEVVSAALMSNQLI